MDGFVDGGADFLAQHSGFELARTIALAHHERWDGGGYPGGLKREGIPMEGRILIISDQYDALRSKRPYKPPFSHADAVRIISQGDGRTMPSHFDPEVLKEFLTLAPLFEEIYESQKD